MDFRHLYQHFNIALNSVLLLCLLFIYGCDECVQYANIKVDYNLNSLKETYKVGDTILISATIDSLITDTESTDTYNYSDLSFSVVLGFEQYFPNPPKYAWDKFEIEANRGNVELQLFDNSEEILQGQGGSYNLIFHKDDSLRLDIMVITKSPGIFFMAISPGDRSNTNFGKVNGCENTYLESMNFNIENISNEMKNFELYDEVVSHQFKNTKEVYESMAVYTFEVNE